MIGVYWKMGFLLSCSLMIELGLKELENLAAC